MASITLKGITWDHPRGYDPLIAASAAYYEEKGIIVEWQKRSLTDFGDFSIESLSEQYDLLILDHPHCGVIAGTGCLVPLEEHLSDELFLLLKAQSAGPSFSSYSFQKHQWALPIDAAFQCGSYRKDLLSDSIPKSWEEVFALAHRLRSNGKYVGMALCPTDSLCAFLSLCNQFGAPIVMDSEELVPHKVGIEILGLMKRMCMEFHPNALDWNPIDLYDYMAQTDDIVYAPLAFNYTNYSRKGFRENRLVFTDSPNAKTVLGGAGIAVSSQCKNSIEAVDYCYWVCSERVQKDIYTVNNGQPGNITCWMDPDANNLTDNFFQNTLQTLESAYVRPRYFGWPSFQEYLGRVLHKHLKNDIDPIVTLRQLQNSFNESKTLMYK
ncbi:extracellular solute-binding protein [Zobellia galactanivorans]|uniref:Extracellular solute-binding protein n=1 Tax=Zobellia galactanivorans (strain DSM 12802 / CCUG 47099 / CIP 106680 / NCIMB 13871 / Dsij) TaxID=63186 RepID=G0L2P0_ZOBGA|nr:extracellular solute-binding protein [Zobellia galactanivorans]MBU3027931.1 hypothetical protein [Zobellia galactanivorans]CAZ95102.1 Conserved hypothetical protein [Zobellia galactanivorans]